MKKATLTGLLVLALAGGISLGACSGGEPTASGSGGSEQIDVDLPEEVSPTLVAGDPSSEVEIQFWHCMGHNRTTQVEKIVTSFNQTWAGKYRVVLSQLAGGYDDLDNAVRTRLAGGEVPALTMAYPDSIAQYISNRPEQSSVYRLDNYIADAELGYSQEELDDFVDEYWAEGSSYHVKGVWSMPFYKSTEIMYYNDNYFHGDNDQNAAKFKGNSEYSALIAAINAAQGIDDYDGMTEALEALRDWVVKNDGYVYQVPATWEEMVAVGRQMKADRAAEGVSGRFFPLGYDSDANFVISQLEQRGIPYTTNDNISTATDHFVFNNDQAASFLTEVTDLIKEGVFITGETSGVSYTNTLFTEGETAMTVGSTGGSSYNVSSNFRVSLAPAPYAGTNQKYIMQGPSICFFINNDPYIQKGAWLFYKAMAETEANTQLALESSYDPVRDSCYETQIYADWVSNYKAGLSYDIPNHTRMMRDMYMTSPVFVGSDVARDQMDLIIARIVNSNYTVEEALDAAYRACRGAVI